MSKVTENKQEICDLLLKTLKATREGQFIVSLRYVNNETSEIVVAEAPNGSLKHINVTMDSGTALIMDVIRQLI